jgi:flagellar biosynthesis/type III secretory pathway M-ring protein FliF/YscJ
VWCCIGWHKQQQLLLLVLLLVLLLLLLVLMLVLRRASPVPLLNLASLENRGRPPIADTYVPCRPGT